MYASEEVHLSHLQSAVKSLHGSTSASVASAAAMALAASQMNANHPIHQLDRLQMAALLGVDRQSSTDRSITATPSQNGDTAQDLDDECSALPIQQHVLEEMNGPETDIPHQIKDLKSCFLYMSHQMSRIMKALHVPPCLCNNCASRHIMMNGTKPLADPSFILQELFPTATTAQLSALVELAKSNAIATSDTNNQQLWLGHAYGANKGGGKMSNNNNNSMEKKPPATDYAKHNGIMSVSKKFAMSASTLHQRKDSSNGMSANVSPGPSSEGETDVASDSNNGHGSATQHYPVANRSDNTSQSSYQQTSHTVPSSPLFPNGMPDMAAMIKMNAAHQSGSPGFLRGRGRGRPKLIGDELDADLVDYMVSVKQADPHGHLTASQALLLAKQYIMEKAPGLLEEHGGHVKLKLTWAMKLVSRIAERQKEMELGLPAGTLSNMGRTQLNSLPGGNFMADMMAQNILSQHMLMGINGNATAASSSASTPTALNAPSSALSGNVPVSLSSNSLMKEEVQQENDESLAQKLGVAPEIMNVKELNMNFLNNLFGTSSTTGLSGVTDGLTADSNSASPMEVSN